MICHVQMFAIILFKTRTKYLFHSIDKLFISFLVIYRVLF